MTELAWIVMTARVIVRMQVLAGAMFMRVAASVTQVK
jgi:hypothetical protein